MANSKDQLILVPVCIQELICGGTAEELAKEFLVWMDEREKNKN